MPDSIGHGNFEVIVSRSPLGFGAVNRSHQDQDGRARYGVRGYSLIGAQEQGANRAKTRQVAPL